MRTTDSCRGSYVSGLPKTSRPTVYSFRFWASPERDFWARYVRRLRWTSDVLKVLLDTIRWICSWFASSSGGIKGSYRGRRPEARDRGRRRPGRTFSSSVLRAPSPESRAPTAYFFAGAAAGLAGAADLTLLLMAGIVCRYAQIALMSSSDNTLEASRGIGRSRSPPWG